jgi:plastocyanin
VRIDVSVAVVLLLAGCSGSSGTKSSTPSGAGGGLRIAGFAYQPTPMTVKAGQKVDVTNADSAEHTVTSDLAGLFLADEVKNGKTVTFTAPAKAGTYTFHCAYHSAMHGTLVVTG